ncbi:VacB/RNase II family 3'-5' exoribonuclease [Gammaproteobacteria bacterium]|jgi:ribonuclease R|nr:VacB/RNase II family 3'-5' exoribonuclease [Gammaproteobacteria bacterium]MDA9920508.1 VacB/RNase II family 3'-5' exoribonuclease [Gammaproteobacteria bacterium]MDB2448434.1 VacB/RNase II family 3'-5' exoribonuclease [Gammaproteobacteria bacterium]MDB2503491.1 VacB/RNase II family 3'-5' exoribonuclease [Gammaproteobacteria bacterium]MDC0348294.1 VacB/RNase II family 3'-5' exoribonuclease [Gammaproteobacteria bacterium]
MNELESTISQIIEENFLPYEWNENIEKELKDLSLNTELNRKDLTQIPFVTIDGADAKDFDDAVFCNLNDKTFILDVAIADVAEIVKLDSALNKEAMQRGTSIYFPSKVIPMLPEKISNNLCSLVPNEVRNVLVCEMIFSLSGEMKSYKFFEARIKSHKRMTYNEVEDFIKNQKLNASKSIKNSLDSLNILTKSLLVKRNKRQALEIDSQEPILNINKNGKVEQISLPQRLYAHQMIEESMLAANVCAASFMNKHYKYGVYRVHEKPDDIKLDSLKSFFSLKGFSDGFKKEPLDLITQCLKYSSKKGLSKILQTVVLQSLKRAEYSTKEIGHFGLQLDRYSHFTSPIRRYPDLMTHRLIKNIINSENLKIDKELIEEDCQEMSELERIAEKSARQVTQQMICYYMKRYIGQEFNSTVTGITDFGLFSEIDGFYVSGLIHVTDLPGDRYFYDREANILKGKKTGRTYRLGQNIKIKIANVTPHERKITLIPNN